MGDGAQAFQLLTPGFSNGDFLPVYLLPLVAEAQGD